MKTIGFGICALASLALLASLATAQDSTQVDSTHAVPPSPAAAPPTERCRLHPPPRRAIRSPS